MTPEQLEEGNRLQEEIKQLEELKNYDHEKCSFRWFVRTKTEICFFKSTLTDGWFNYESKPVPKSVAKRFLEIIEDELEARKIMLADLGEE